jgi:hypothetical protein
MTNNINDGEDERFKVQDVNFICVLGKKHSLTGSYIFLQKTAVYVRSLPVLELELWV